MDDLYAVAPAPANSGEFVELSSKGSKYRVFEKHILNIGTLLYGNRKIDIDDEFYNTMVRNFEKGISPVSVPKVDAKNRHIEDPDANIGKVIGLSRRGDKIYARFEVRDEDAAQKVGKTYLGASAFFNTNYPDTSTGEKVGPTLLHVAVTNRPYVNNLEDYSEVFLSRVADGNVEAVMLTAESKETSKMETLEEILTALKVDHGIDVRDLQARASEGEKAVALSAQIYQDLVEAEFVALSADGDDEITYDAIKSAIDNTREQIVALSAQVADMTEEKARTEAEAKVDKLIEGAFIAEDKRDVYVKLAMTDNDTFEALVPAEAMVSLSAEAGTSEDTTPEDKSEEAEAQAALERILSYEGFSFSESK